MEDNLEKIILSIKSTNKYCKLKEELQDSIDYIEDPLIILNTKTTLSIVYAIERILDCKSKRLNLQSMTIFLSCLNIIKIYLTEDHGQPDTLLTNIYEGEIRSILMQTKNLLFNKDVPVSEKKSLLYDLCDWIDFSNIYLVDVEFKLKIINDYREIISTLDEATLLLSEYKNNIVKDTQKLVKTVETLLKSLMLLSINNAIDIIAPTFMHFEEEFNNINNKEFQTKINRILLSLKENDIIPNTIKISRQIDEILPNYFNYNKIVNPNYQEIVDKIYQDNSATFEVNSNSYFAATIEENIHVDSLGVIFLSRFLLVYDKFIFTFFRKNFTQATEFSKFCKLSNIFSKISQYPIEIVSAIIWTSSRYYKYYQWNKDS